MSACGGDTKADLPIPERLPPSTARLVGEGGESGDSRGKRKRKMTEAYRQARQAGLQSLWVFTGRGIGSSRIVTHQSFYTEVNGGNVATAR